ncbi:hypothetical protein GCM10010517_08370 [Streptosporangium fragile]|uniref:DUF4352 domain-containing protein n=1 Tax=Streptosporangium fragile TaxID=46186 RepID=A0ABP6I9G6_9ACTN
MVSGTPAYMAPEQASVAAATQVVSDTWTPLLPATTEPRRRAAPLAAAALAVLVTAGVSLAAWRPWAGTDANARPTPSVSTVLLTATATVTREAAAPADSTPPERAEITTPVRVKPSAPTGTLRPGTKQAGATFVHGNPWGKNIPGHVQITTLARKGDDLRLEATIRNTSADGRIYLDYLLASGLNGNQVNDLQNIQLFVPGETFPLQPFREGDKCACTSWAATTILEAGQSMHLYAVFRKVPEDTRTVDVILPTMGTFRNLLITGR